MLFQNMLLGYCPTALKAFHLRKLIEGGGGEQVNKATAIYLGEMVTKFMQRPLTDQMVRFHRIFIDSFGFRIL